MSVPPSHEQDARDMALLATGNAAALDELMARHAERLYHYLLRSLQDPADAADIAQETFVRVFQNRARFSRTQKFSTWLYAIASNLVRDRYRWRARHPQVSLDAEEEHSKGGIKNTLRSAETSPDQELQNAEQTESVRQAVAELPLELRQPLILSFYEDLSHAEIGEVLECSPKAVETRIYRARQKLKASLAQLVDFR